MFCTDLYLLLCTTTCDILSYLTYIYNFIFVTIGIYEDPVLVYLINVS